MQALEQRGVSPDGNDLIRHNMVVFKDGEGALQVNVVPSCSLDHHLFSQHMCVLAC